MDFGRPMIHGEKSSLGFEICRTSRRVPDQWRTSRITLICKNPDGDLDEVSNWRPISVCRTLYKIYAAVLARSLQAWALERGVISPEQKGFMPAEGTFEHVFILDTSLVDSKSAKNNIYVAWLDINNAFGSVQHECIQVVMRAFGVPSYLVEYIADIYARNTTVVRTAGGVVTGEIPVCKGVRQGCPLSGIVFNLVAEVLVRGVKAVHNAGYKFSCADVFAQVLMYADDGCLLASSLLSTTGAASGL